MQTTRGLDRLVFFTDAVAAIAITLLILPLVDSVSQSANKGLDPAQFIGDNLAQIGAFVLSFAVIARMWLTHHSIFEHVRSYNRPLLLLNLGWAFTIVLLPLPTEMVSQFDTTPLTVGFYIGTMAASSLLLMLMALLTRRHPQLELDENPVSGRTVLASVTVTIGFFVALVVGVLVPAINFYALLVMLLIIPLQRIYNRRADAAARATT
jgi:TMEM175 potassium channel family protein